MNTNKYLVAGIVRPSLYESQKMPRIWIQCSIGGPVFYTQDRAVERANEINKTTDDHHIRNAQVIELMRDDYSPY